MDSMAKAKEEGHAAVYDEGDAGMFDTCYLHIGLGKTGTTSIQAAMYSNSARLEAQSILYPTISSNHYFLASYFVDRPENLIFHRDSRRTLPEIAEFNRDHMTRFREACRGSACKTVVLSSEFLAGLSLSGIVKLKDFLESIALHIKVVVYLRHPVSYIESFVQQHIKTGHARFSSIGTRNAPNLSGFVSAWASVFGRNSLILRNFAPNGNKIDVLVDFISLIQADVDHLDLNAGKAPNTSLSGLSAMIADACYELAPSGSKERELLISILDRIKGPRFVLEEDVRDAIRRSSIGDLKVLDREWGIKLHEEMYVKRRDGLIDNSTIDSLSDIFLEKISEGLASAKLFETALSERDAAIAERDAARTELGNRRRFWFLPR